MKHLLRDICIFLASILGIVFLYRWMERKKGPLVRIVVFHDVADGAWFASVISMLASRYHLITPQDFHARVFDPKKINVLLTFDDGYRSWIDIVLPILERTTLKGLFFVNSGLLDVAHDPTLSETYMKERLLISPKTPLSYEDARELALKGHTLGGHSATHKNLTELDERELIFELQSDKEKLEKELGVTLQDFAYPFGTGRHYDARVTAGVHQAGYAYAYTAESGFANENAIVEGRIPRVCLEKNQGSASVRRWVEGGYDIFSRIYTSWNH